MPMSDLMADSDASYLTSNGQSDANQAMVKQYSGDYGQDSKHSVLGTLIGMIPGWGSAIQSMMPDGSGIGASFASGQAAQGGANPTGYDAVSSKGDGGGMALMGQGAGGGMGQGGNMPAQMYPFLQMIQGGQDSGPAQGLGSMIGNYAYGVS